MKTRLLTLVALAAAACFANQGKNAGTQPQRTPYRLPHSLHTDVACAECHSPVLTATKLEPDVIHVKLPSASDTCTTCHPTIPAYNPVQRIEPAVHFDHAAHLPRVKNVCTSCHVKVSDAGDVKTPVPPMASCTACHGHAQEFAVGRCMPCHRDLKQYPLKPLAEYTHAANFLETHGKWARQSASTCLACHDQAKCSSCHTAATRPLPPDVEFPDRVTANFIHRGDFVSRHAFEQQANPASCLKCHGTGFCQGCHDFSGLPAGKAQHPPGWVASHGPVARSNIASCSACHNQGARAICVQCHATGGTNPHPPGWKGTVAQQSNSMCRICHH